MKIESIKIENYKAFKDAELKSLPKMAVLLGANGSGKSTFFDVFGFLSDALQQNVTIALNKRGGFAEVITRGCDVAKDLIKFEIKFRDTHQDKRSPIITYSLDIGFRTGKAYINREILRYRRGQRGKPWHFLDFSNGEGTAVTNESDYGSHGVEEKRMNQKVTSPDILAIKGLGQFEQFGVVSKFRELLEKWYVSNFKIDNGRSISDVGISDHLSITGDNLAQVTKYMYEYHRKLFNDVLEKLPRRIPGITQVEAKETEDGRIVLRFKDENFKDPFVARYVSDGTIKMFAYMILLHDPEPHPLLCIEEPENFLHPDLLLQLCEEIREYSERGGQVFVSTHSPEFVNGLKIDELFYIKKENGLSHIYAVNEDVLAVELAKDNQLGWLWRNKYIHGANL
ncbi:MAG: AAA family ATPase [Burkholderiales bacterium]|nr:AAA family ATPase [Burkholderiales bacterium]